MAGFRKTSQTSCFNISRKWMVFACFSGCSADNDKDGPAGPSQLGISAQQNRVPTCNAVTKNRERRDLMMHTRVTLLLFSGAIGLCLSGCAATSPVMRGQSWDGGADMMMNGDCQACESQYGMDGSGMGMPMEYEGDLSRREMKKVCRPQRGCQGCSGRGCDQYLNVPFHPVHRNFHTYDVPQGLSYPQEENPTAAVQYPYYTFRGPTDFFMQ
jgi:hypothetical protein